MAARYRRAHQNWTTLFSAVDAPIPILARANVINTLLARAIGI
jgi:hypothetical protein